MPFLGEMEMIEDVTTIRDELELKIDGMPYASGSDAFEKIYQYTGTSVEALMKAIPQLKAPSVVIWYSGSRWGNKPRRTSNFHLYVVVKNVRNDWMDSDDLVSTYVGDLADFLHRTILIRQCKLMFEQDNAVAVDKGIAMRDIKLRIEDY